MLRILVATMTGTAEMVAEALRDRIAEAGGKAEIVLMDGLDPSVFESGHRYLICSSTYGQGDVPDNAQALFEKLSAERPDLGGVEFALVALGDMTYAQTFCFGGKRFGRLLEELGASLLGEPMFHDASAGTLPEDVAVDWLDAWLAVHDVCGRNKKAA
jgi:MioC protein